MKPKFPRWTNPYIDKVESLPGFLAPCYGPSPSEEEVSMLKKKIAGFGHLFCELGCGSGKHLVERASQDTDSCYIGFELRYKRAFKSAIKAARQGLQNVFVLRTNVFLLSSLFEAASIDGIYINFPDPWDKKRWEGNRMLSPGMLKSIATLLKPQGFISYKTDHIERFRETLSNLEEMPDFELLHYTEDLYSSGFLEKSVRTEFEGLFKSKDVAICFLIARKKVLSAFNSKQAVNIS